MSAVKTCSYCGKHPKGHEVYECRASLAKQLRAAQGLLAQWCELAQKPLGEIQCVSSKSQ